MKAAYVNGDTDLVGAIEYRHQGDQWILRLHADESIRRFLFPDLRCAFWDAVRYTRSREFRIGGFSAIDKTLRAGLVVRKFGLTATIFSR